MKKTRRTVAYVLLVLIGVVTPIGYGVADRMANGEPKPSLSTGWVALVASLTLQKPGGQGELDSAWLFVDTLDSSGVGLRPADTSYTVLLCGKGLVHVGLLLNGGAMLVAAKAPVVPVVNPPAPPTQWSSVLTLMTVAVGVGGGILATILISGLLALAEHEHLVKPRRRRRR